MFTMRMGFAACIWMEYGIERRPSMVCSKNYADGDKTKHDCRILERGPKKLFRMPILGATDGRYLGMLFAISTSPGRAWDQR